MSVARPWWGPLAIVGFVALVVASRMSDVVWANWVNDHPAGLLALSARNRWLALTVAAGVSPLSYALIGAVRIAAAFVVCHLIGRAYADVALSWFVRYLGVTRESLDIYNRKFNAWEIGLVPFFVGSNIVAVLTGVHRTPPKRLAVLASVGIAGRLALYWALAKLFEDQLVGMLHWIARYQWWILVASVVLVIIVNVRNFRQGANH